MASTTIAVAKLDNDMAVKILRLLPLMLPCASKYNSRYAIDGVLFSLQRHDICIAVTDGRQAVKHTFPLDTKMDHGVESVSVVLTTDSVKVLKAVFAKHRFSGKEQFEIVVKRDKAITFNDKITFSGDDLVDGVFPPMSVLFDSFKPTESSSFAVDVGLLGSVAKALGGQSACKIEIQAGNRGLRIKNVLGCDQPATGEAMVMPLNPA